LGKEIFVVRTKLGVVEQVSGLKKVGGITTHMTQSGRCTATQNQRKKHRTTTQNSMKKSAPDSSKKWQNSMKESAPNS
jgi:hypothetical protein